MARGGEQRSGRGGRARRVRGLRKRWILLGAVVLIVIGAAAYGANYYLTDIPKDRAADYHANAEPALKRVDAALNDVFPLVGEVTADLGVSDRQLKRAERKEKTAQLFLRFYRRVDFRLVRLRGAIKRARGRLEPARAHLRDTPSGWLIDDTPAIDATEEAARAGAPTLKQIQGYLDSLKAFIGSYRDLNDFRRRAQLIRRDLASEGETSIEEEKAKLRKLIEKLSRINAAVADAKPHPALEAHYKENKRSRRRYIGYLEAILAAYVNLSPTQFDAAQESFKELRRDSRRAQRKANQALLDSKLVKARRSIEDELEEAFEALDEVEALASEE